MKPIASIPVALFLIVLLALCVQSQPLYLEHADGGLENLENEERLKRDQNFQGATIVGDKVNFIGESYQETTEYNAKVGSNHYLSSTKTLDEKPVSFATEPKYIKICTKTTSLTSSPTAISESEPRSTRSPNEFHQHFTGSTFQAQNIKLNSNGNDQQLSTSSADKEEVECRYVQESNHEEQSAQLDSKISGKEKREAQYYNEQLQYQSQGGGFQKQQSLGYSQGGVSFPQQNFANSHFQAKNQNFGETTIHENSRSYQGGHYEGKDQNFGIWQTQSQGGRY